MPTATLRSAQLPELCSRVTRSVNQIPITTSLKRTYTPRSETSIRFLILFSLVVHENKCFWLDTVINCLSSFMSVHIYTQPFSVLLFSHADRTAFTGVLLQDISFKGIFAHTVVLPRSLKIVIDLPGKGVSSCRERSLAHNMIY